MRWFKHRYFKNDKYWDRENGPIFINLCGEYVCNVNPDRMYPWQLAAKYKALMLVVEHRYYGKSQPVENWETPNLAYLNTEQALADLAGFVDSFTRDYPNRKVLIIGGSYPGAMSAWFRLKYPHLADASWASSAGVYPVMDMWKYDEHVWTATSKHSLECPDVIKNLTEVANEYLFEPHTPESKEHFLAIFGADISFDDGDMSYYFADIFATSVQYGGRTKLCNLMSEIKGLPEEDQLNHLKEHADSVGVKVKDYDRRLLNQTAIDPMGWGRQWTYQYCTQFGLFQIPGKYHKLRLSILNHYWWETLCKDLFGVKLGLQRTLDHFTGHKFAGTKTIFTNGIDDPW